MQARLEQLEALAAERQTDLEAAEEEKYMLSSDLEVQREELADANAHQKRALTLTLTLTRCCKRSSRMRTPTRSGTTRP